MDKLKELFKQGWMVHGTYDNGIFFLVATYGDLEIVESASHPDLEMAVIELYAKCMVTDDLPITS